MTARTPTQTVFVTTWTAALALRPRKLLTMSVAPTLKLMLTATACAIVELKGQAHLNVRTHVLCLVPRSCLTDRSKPCRCRL